MTVQVTTSEANSCGSVLLAQCRHWPDVRSPGNHRIRPTASAVTSGQRRKKGRSPGSEVIGKYLRLWQEKCCKAKKKSVETPAR